MALGLIFMYPKPQGPLQTLNKDVLKFNALFPMRVGNRGFRFAPPTFHSCHRFAVPISYGVLSVGFASNLTLIGDEVKAQA